MRAPEVRRRVGELVGATPTGIHAVTGGEICDAYRVTFDTPDTPGSPAMPDGGGARRELFAKTLPRTPPGGSPPDSGPRPNTDFFTAEAAGLARLRATGAVATPRVIAAEPDLLVLEWVPSATPTPAGAERLGRELAALHATPFPHYGTEGPLYLGPVPLTTPTPPPTDPAGWPALHAEHRLLPLLRLAVDGGGIGARDAAAVERLCSRLAEVAGSAGPPQPPAVIHGDLWAGNILWADRPHLIDPAAQGGHPEQDLAFLEMSGCPHWDRVIGAYEEVRPLPGRAARAPLHQLHHVLIHAALFGGGYGPQSGSVARAALALG